jgi:hexosaminidase
MIFAGCLLLAFGVDPDKFSPLFPAPLYQSNGNATLEVSSSLHFELGTPSAIVEAATLRYTKLMFAWGAGKNCSSQSICVRNVVITVADTSDELQLGVDESYELTVSAKGEVEITAPAPWGAMHALETLSQLIETDNGGYVLAHAPWTVRDAPRFQHRAVMIDTARHFLSVETIKRQIDAASYCKLNTIHWHTTDAESMPIESKAFPALHSKGAFSPRFFYSTTQVRDIVAYGHQRGVRIVAEFDMPGHNYAFFLGMPSLMCDCPDVINSTNVDTQFWRASFDPTNEAVQCVHASYPTVVHTCIVLYCSAYMHRTLL